MQPTHEIEASYCTPDPWQYQNDPRDLVRKEKIIETAKRFSPFPLPYRNALDIGAGEGWITKDFPATIKHGYELSQQARDRFPENVIAIGEPVGSYELITATGVMYDHYNWPWFMHLIDEHASNIVITCNIKTWEIPALRDERVIKDMRLSEIFTEEFEYREFIQKLRVFKRIG